MKVQVRYSCFETNSSSTHSVVIMTDEEYKDYLNHEFYLNRDGEKVSKDKYERVKEKYLKKALDMWEHKDRDCQYYRSPSDMAEDMINEELEMYCIDDVHEQRVINGTLVHAIPIYGADE